ncbi:MAG: hypothetical protein ACK413_03320 [Patescibacteria group bacterium]
MDKGSCRWEINKAEKMKDRISIKINENIEDFLNLYNRFVKLKKHTNPISLRILKEYLRFSDIFLLYFDGKPRVGHLFLRDENIKRVRLLFSATTRLESENEARLSGMLNRYLHWIEIQYFKNLGFKIFDWGGAGTGKEVENITKFKMSFGGIKVNERNYIFARFPMRIILKIKRIIKRIIFKL